MEYLTQLIEDYLKNNGLWMSAEDREKAAQTAAHLYEHMDYSSMEAAAEDAAEFVGETIHDFKLKVFYHAGKLTVDYCDGSDAEVHDAEPDADAISEVLQDAVESVLSCADER